MKRERIDTLDYLRGVLATSVMLYHYYNWSGTPHGTDIFTTAIDDLLRKLGVYGVSSFYVLSGISLGYVYNKMTLDSVSLRNFAIKRFARIAPLFWLATALTLAIPVAKVLTGGVGPDLPSIQKLLLNITLLFGFVAPTETIPGPGWSIGNELVFYAAFPFLVVAIRRGGIAAMAAMASSIALGMYFAFVLLDPTRSLLSQWATYVNPFNQFFLFAMGVAVAQLYGRVPHLSGRRASIILILLLAAFMLYPVTTQSEIVAGGARVYFSAISIAAAAVCLLVRAEVPRRLRIGLKFLGATSYSIYLLHLVVYDFVRVGLGLFEIRADWALVGVSIPATLLASHLSYTYLERTMMRFGSRFTTRQVPVAAEANAGA